MSREYLGLFIYPQKPSAGLPNLVRLSLKSSGLFNFNPIFTDEVSYYYIFFEHIPYRPQTHVSQSVNLNIINR
jgi:hypothetical protein